MELRHLRYFVAVAEALSFRGAAERLRVAQPALSRQIKDLEEEVGVRLFDRNTAGVKLTDAGAVFLDESRDILERAEMAISAARDAEAGKAGRLMVGNLGALSASFLPPTLSAFRARFPQVEVNLVEMPLPDQLTALRAGTIQIGFTIQDPVDLPSNLATTEVLVSRIAAALGRDHALARETRVSLVDLAHERLLCIGQSEQHDFHRKRVEAIFAARGIRHLPIRRVNSFESLVAMVAGDHGASLLTPFAPAASAENIVFRRIKEDGDDLVLHLSAFWRKGVTSRLLSNFVEVLRSLSPRPG